MPYALKQNKQHRTRHCIILKCTQQYNCVTSFLSTQLSFFPYFKTLLASLHHFSPGISLLHQSCGSKGYKNKVRHFKGKGGGEETRKIAKIQETKSNTRRHFEIWITPPSLSPHTVTKISNIIAQKEQRKCHSLSKYACFLFYEISVLGRLVDAALKFRPPPVLKWAKNQVLFTPTHAFSHTNMYWSFKLY